MSDKNKTIDIDVTGINPWELLAALHNGSRVSPTVVCRAQAGGEITAEEARGQTLSEIREGYEFPLYLGGAPLWPDYLFGRPIKAHLKYDGDTAWLVRADLYDRDIGEGAAQRVIEGLRG